MAVCRASTFCSGALVGRVEPNELEVEGVEIALLEFGDTSFYGIADGFDPLERQGLGRINFAGDVRTVEEFTLGEVEALPGAPNELIQIDLRCGHSSSLCAKEGFGINPDFGLFVIHSDRFQ